MERLKWYKITDTHRNQVDMVLPATDPYFALVHHNDLVWGELYSDPDNERYKATEVQVKDKE